MVVARVCSKSMYESAEEICVNYYYYLLKIFKGELLYSDRVHSRTPVCARIPVLISHTETEMLALQTCFVRQIPGVDAFRSPDRKKNGRCLNGPTQLHWYGIGPGSLLWCLEMGRPVLVRVVVRLGVCV